MQKLDLLIEEYKDYASQQGFPKAQAKVTEFTHFIGLISDSDTPSPLRIKYAPYHTIFLIRALSLAKKPSNLSFTLTIQVLNFLLRQQPDYRFQCQKDVLLGIRQHLDGDSMYVDSPSVISNVVWLVGRCIQMSKDRRLFLEGLCESRLVQRCLDCPSFESSTEKGLSIILSYMSKLGLVKKQFSIKLVPHLFKFQQKDSRREVLTLLRIIGLDSLKNCQQMLSTLTNFLVQFLNASDINDQELHHHWELVVLIAYHFPASKHQLPVKAILERLTSLPQLSVSEELLNKIFDVALASADSRSEEVGQLKQGALNMLSNCLCRRLFIHSYQKITAPVYFQILSGELPVLMEGALKVPDQRNKTLKLLICLKRVAWLRGMQSFYTFKLKGVEQKIVDGLVQQSQELTELLQILKDLSMEQPIDDSHHSW